METILSRLKYYGIGFGIGLFFLFFFFENRGCSWLPANRVKNSILERLLVVSNETYSILQTQGLSAEDIVQVLNDGEVNFAASDKQSEPKIYIVEKDKRKYAFTLPKESFISEVFVRVNDTRLQKTEQGSGRIIHFPMDDNIVFSDTNSRLKCQQSVLGLENDKAILELLKESGKMDFGKSNLGKLPKPEHYLTFEKDGEKIGVRVIWYKNKLNITAFESESIIGCE
jgi:hypothetical protein